MILFLDNKCIECGSMIERMYCLKCRKMNAKNIKKTIETNQIKSEIIRIELMANPSLEMDLLCEMKRRKALDSLLIDINKLSIGERGKWILLMFDMDYLKAWNDSIGHVSTDKLIKEIGNIMHKYNNQINNGKWSYKPWLKQSFIFRFVFIIFYIFCLK